MLYGVIDHNMTTLLPVVVNIDENDPFSVTKIVIYPYPFLVIITQLLFRIIFINDCICILTHSHE